MKETPESAECTGLPKQKHVLLRKRKDDVIYRNLAELPDYLVEFFQQPQCGNKIVFIGDWDKQGLASSE